MSEQSQQSQHSQHSQHLQLRRSARIAAQIQSKLLSDKRFKQQNTKRASAKERAKELSPTLDHLFPFANFSPSARGHITHTRQTSSEVYNMFKRNADGSHALAFIAPNSASDTVMLKGTLTDGTNVILKCAPLPINMQYDNSLVIEATIYKTVISNMLYNKLTPHVVAAHDVIVCNEFHDFLEVLWKTTKGNDKESWARALRRYDKLIKSSCDYFSSSVIITILEQSSNQTLYDWLKAHARQRNTPDHTARLVTILFQILYTLYTFSRYRLRHNDLHFGNIFVEPTTVDHFEYVLNDSTIYRVPTFGLCIKIYDFDRSFAGYENTVLTNEYCEGYGTCNQDNPVYDTFSIFYQFFVSYAGLFSSALNSELKSVVQPHVVPIVWQKAIEQQNYFPMNHLMCNVKPDHSCVFTKGTRERTFGFPDAYTLIVRLPAFQRYKTSAPKLDALTFYASKSLNKQPPPEKVFAFNLFRKNPVCEDSWIRSTTASPLNADEQKMVQTAFHVSRELISKRLNVEGLRTETRVYVEMYDRVAFYINNIYGVAKRERKTNTYPLPLIVAAICCISLYNRLRIFDLVNFKRSEVALRSKREEKAEIQNAKRIAELNTIYKEIVDAIILEMTKLNYFKAGFDAKALTKVMHHMRNIIRENHVTTMYDYLFNCANIVGDKQTSDRIREFMKSCTVYFGIFVGNTDYMSISPLERAKFVVYMVKQGIEPVAIPKFMNSGVKIPEEILHILKIIMTNPDYIEFKWLAPHVTFVKVPPVIWT